MFSGIVEATARIQEAKGNGNVTRIVVERPSHFSDIQTGDSIASNGVCLTIEKFSDDDMVFALGEETLHITGWSADRLVGKILNLERSLKLGDRIHGHWVSGHVDTVGTVHKKEKNESWLFAVQVPRLDRRYVWTKGCVAINGISLTINDIQENILSFCLIPETIDRTNLKNLNVGDTINIEYDYWTKAFVNFQEVRGVEK